MVRTHLLLAGLLLLVPVTAAHAQSAEGGDARDLAQQILDKGSALFDTQDADAMAATYTRNATVFLVSKDQDSGNSKIDTRTGRSDLREMYRDLYHNRDRGITSKNTVEYARQISPDLLVIHGYFQPDRDENARYPFVQVRQKDGDQWQIMSLRLFLTPLDR